MSQALEQEQAMTLEEGVDAFCDTFEKMAKHVELLSKRVAALEGIVAERLGVEIPDQATDGK